MRIFAHKGLWSSMDEANTLLALERALASGFDVETDIRVQSGNFIIKHDPLAENEVALGLEDILRLLKRYDKKHIALHAKNGDREQRWPLEKIVDLLAPFADRVFLFDLALEYCQALRKMNKNIRTGVSVGDKKYHDRFCDLEEALESDSIDIIWADEYRNLYSQDFVNICHEYGKIVYCISPDLAGVVGHPRARDGYQETWKDLLQWGADGICTDYPRELRDCIAVCK